MNDELVSEKPRRASRAGLEVLSVFLRLGCTSFGGPVAHLGYFRTELLERRGEYAALWRRQTRAADAPTLEPA